MEEEEQLIVAEEIVKRLIGLIGFDVTIKQFQKKIKIKKYVSVIVYQEVYESTDGNSYFRLGVSKCDINFSRNIYLDKFHISTKSEEFAMKINDVVQDGSVLVKAGNTYISIGVSVKKASYYNINFKGTILINIDLPGDEDREKFRDYVKNSKNQEAQEIQNAFEIGASAVAGIILAKIIKSGLGAIFGGPVGAAIGFAT